LMRSLWYCRKSFLRPLISSLRDDFRAGLENSGNGSWGRIRSIQLRPKVHRADPLPGDCLWESRTGISSVGVLVGGA